MTSILSLLSVFFNMLANQQEITPAESNIGFSNDICDGSSICQEWYEEVSRNPRYIHSLEIRDVTDLNAAEQLRSPRSSENSLACPAFTEEYLRNVVRIKDRSLSPWRWVINYDRNRTPQKIPETQCLCTGCIDPKTGRETKNLISVGITVTQRVNYTNTGEEALLTTQLGCRCDFPVVG